MRTRRSTREVREGARAGCPQYNRRENQGGSASRLSQYNTERTSEEPSTEGSAREERKECEDQEEREGNVRGSASRLSAVQPQRERGGEHQPGGARRKCVREREQALRSTTAERTRWGKEVLTKKLYGGEQTATIQAGRLL